MRAIAGLLGTMLERGSHVIVECDQSVAYFLCLLASQLAGMVPTPLERKAAASRVSGIANETGCTLFIGHSEPETLEGTGLAFLSFAEALDSAVPAETDTPSLPAPDDVAEILFSTGTTGKSKGVVMENRANIAICEGIIDGLSMLPDNVELVAMPTSHAHGLRSTYANIANGSSVVFANGVIALKRVFDLMDTYHVTAMDLGPSMLSIIFKLSKDRLGSYDGQLDYIQLGSAPLPEDDKQHLVRILPHARLYNFYGSTEAGRSCVLEFSAVTNRENCIGRPTQNARFIVVDDDRNPIESSPEHPGLLASAGAINMREYYHEPELTAQAMQNGYIYTKDLGYIGDDGLIYMLGRKDDVINFGGVKISPEEIESAVIKHEQVKDCACVPVPDAVSGQIPKLFIALEEGVSAEDFDLRAFRSFLASALDADKQPQRIEVIDEIPRTYNGKIIRRELVARG